MVSELQKLADIGFYKLHPSYIPFVGDKYNEFRILQISESHYCNNLDVSKYGIPYFIHWYDSVCNEVEEGILGNNITRYVGNGVVGNIKNDDGSVNSYQYQNFDNPLRSFRKIVLGKEGDINPETRKDYNYFAFMNFYQFPALEAKGHFPDTIKRRGKTEGCKELAKVLLRISNDNSTRIVDSVIDVLSPRVVVFTSFCAGDAYKECGGKYAQSENVVYVSHPNNPFPWSKSYKRLGWKKPITVFEAKLREIYKNT